MEFLTTGYENDPFLQEAEAVIVAAPPSKPTDIYLKWRATKGVPLKIVQDGTFAAYAEQTGIASGLSFYNKEEKKEISIKNGISFIVLAIAGTMKRNGYVEGEHAKNGAYSNYVADTRSQKFIVKLPKDYGGNVIFDGFYSDWKNNQNGCKTAENDFLKYAAVLVAYIPELKMIAEIESKTFTDAMCAAVKAHAKETSVEQFDLVKFQYEHYRFFLDDIDFVVARNPSEFFVAPKFRITGITENGLAAKKEMQSRVMTWLKKEPAQAQPQILQPLLSSSATIVAALPQQITPTTKPTELTYDAACNLLKDTGAELVSEKASRAPGREKTHIRLDYRYNNVVYAFECEKSKAKETKEYFILLPF